MVAAADDDQILEPPGDEQLTIPHESEIAGAQEWPRPAILQKRLKRLRRLHRAIPVALRDTWAGDPDLADLARPAAGAGLGMRQHDVLIRQRLAAADQRPRRRMARRCFGDTIVRQRRLLEAPNDGRRGCGTARDDQ